jgi:hypothetical protein
MHESGRERQVTAAVRNVGGLAIKLFGGFFIGLPDRLILLPGGVVRFAEIKADGKDIIKGSAQDNVRRKLQKLGFVVDVIKDDETFKQFKNEIRALGIPKSRD